MKITSNFALFCKLTGLALILYVVFCGYSANAQTAGPSASPVYLKDTTINKTIYNIYKGARSGKYVPITSKTGRIYKRYIK